MNPRKLLALIVCAFWAFVAPLRVPLRYYNRASRRLMGYKSPIARGYHLMPMAGGAIIVGTRSPLFYKQVAGGLPAIVDTSVFTGNIFFVDSAVGTDSAGYGTTPDAPLATIDYAIGLCTASQGDVILVLPGHSESLAAAITVDKAGISIIGLGEGTARPQLTGALNTLDCITITADNVLVENLYFNEATVSANASNINIAAANAIIRRVHMDMGANDRDGFTITAAGERPTIEDCSLVVTANGPDTWITFEGVIDRPIIRRNVIIGSDGTNALDDGVMDFGALAVTNPIVYENDFNGADQVLSVLDDVGAVVGDAFGPNRYSGSATDGDTVFYSGVTLADNAITAAKIAADAIGASEIADGAIDAGALAADCITAAKIADNAIAAEHIANAAIDAATFAADALQAFQDEAEDALEGENLDHLAAVTTAAADMTTEVVDGSILSRVLSKTSDTSTYDPTTDALEMASDKLGAFSGDGGAAQDDSVKASLDLAHTDLDSILTNLTTIDDFLDTEIAAILADTGTDGVVIAADGITAAKIADNALATEHFAASAGEKTTDGIIITRATAALPQSTSGDIFTVTGLCLVKRIVGYVTVQIGAFANATKLKVNSTGAGATTDICGTVELNAAAVDTNLQITGTFANAMVATIDIPIAKQQATEIVVPPGSIMLDCAGSDGGTGRIRWSVTYVPLEAGASIVAA